MDSKQKQGGTADEKLPWGELVVCNGRHTGARRPLVGPLTLLGRAAGCDIRLQIEGVDARHCVLALTPDGPILRDLQSEGGTLVNGSRIRIALLQEGDCFTVGLFQFKIQGLAKPSAASEQAEQQRLAEENAATRDALRIQAAAVAAQQIALEEEEVKLDQRRQELTQQEGQVAAHLEDRRRQLLTLSEEAKAERETLERERTAHDTYIAKLTGDLTNSQRELMEGQRQVEKQRQRLFDLQQRLKQRWHRFWVAERKKFRAQQAELVKQIETFQERVQEHTANEETLERNRLRFNALYEMSRGQLREAWTKLRQEQHRWKHRRGKERAVLKVRERDLETAERQLVHAQRLFLLDKKSWDAKKETLEMELGGVDRRVQNQRLRILDGRDALRRLEDNLRQQQGDAAPANAEGQPATDVAIAAPTEVASQENASPANTGDTAAAPSPVAPKSRKARKASPVATQDAASASNTWQSQLEKLEGLSGALADQRLELVDQWQRLAVLVRTWQREKETAARELEDLAQKLLLQGQTLAQKEQEQETAVADLRKQHEDVVQLRHQMIAWRARLRTREQSWEGERAKLLTQIRHRESLAEQQHASLVDLRQRWSVHRKQELHQVHADREELETLRKELHLARADLLQRTTALEDEKRQLVEKSLAIEQLRNELLQKSAPEVAERKLERYRRRWLTQNTVTLRQIARERQTLRDELANLDTRWAALKERADAVNAAETSLSERQTAWEHQQTLTLTRQSRLQEELRHAEMQRSLSEQQYDKLKGEVDRIARAIFAEPETPLLITEAAA